MKKSNEGRTPPWLILFIVILSPVSLWAGAAAAGNAWAWGLSILSNGALSTPALQIGSVAGDLATPGNGSLWYDSTRKSFRGNTHAGLGGLSMLFTPPIADSGTLSNPTSATVFSSKVTLLAGVLSVGKVGRVRAHGRFTSGTAITPTLNLGLNVGGAAFATSGLIPISISLTNQAWMLQSSFTVRSIGAAGTIVGWARGELGGILALTTPTAMIGRSGVKTVNADGALDVEATALFGASDASNAITLEGLEVELVN